MTDHDLHSLTGAYVLDALDPAEIPVFRAHLDVCSACRDEVDTFNATVARLAGAGAATPPPDMLRSVMADVARTPQSPAAQSPVPRSPAPGAAAGRSIVLTIGRHRWTAIAAAAAVVLGVGAGATVIYRDHAGDQAYASLQSEVMRIVSAPDVVTHDLELGESHVAMSPEMSKAAVMGEDVPMPEDSGMVYQVWMIHADGTAAAGPTFMPHAGEVMAVVEGDLSAVTELTVTTEPEGGSAEPTGRVVATVTL